MNTHTILLNLNDLEIKLLRDATANLGTDCVNNVTLQLKIAHAILDSSYRLPPIQQEPFVDFSGLGIAKSSSTVNEIKLHDRVETEYGVGTIVKIIEEGYCGDPDTYQVQLDNPVMVISSSNKKEILHNFSVLSIDVKKI